MAKNNEKRKRNRNNENKTNNSLHLIDATSLYFSFISIIHCVETSLFASFMEMFFKINHKISLGLVLFLNNLCKIETSIDILVSIAVSSNNEIEKLVICTVSSISIYIYTAIFLTSKVKSFVAFSSNERGKFR